MDVEVINMGNIIKCGTGLPITFVSPHYWGGRAKRQISTLVRGVLEKERKEMISLSVLSGHKQDYFTLDSLHWLTVFTNYVCLVRTATQTCLTLIYVTKQTILEAYAA